ncbi:hypothetical protein V3C99_004464, partial [Haemonchus contortus]
RLILCLLSAIVTPTSIAEGTHTFLGLLLNLNDLIMDPDTDTNPLTVSTSTNSTKGSTTAAEPLPSTAPVVTQQTPLAETSVHSSYTSSEPPDESMDPSIALDRLSIRRQPERLPASATSTTKTRGLPRQGPLRARSHKKAFKTLRKPTSLSSRPSKSTKRTRLGETVMRKLQVIQHRPAHPPEWEQLVHLHPWAIYIMPRPPVESITEESVTSKLPLRVYRQIPQNGYFAKSFVRSLFPRRFSGIPSPANPLPFIEITRLTDIIAFRQHAIQLTTALLNDQYESDQDSIRRLPQTKGETPTRLVPPSRDGVRPVLYQVVCRSYGQGVLLEAKDFFIPGPDLRELHCLPLTQDSVNVLTGTRGFVRDQLSIKDFTWVYSLKPTLKTLSSSNCRKILRQARQPRPSVVTSSAPYFFRVHEFILVTPSPLDHHVLGLVTDVSRGGSTGVNNILVAFQGCRDAVRVSRQICDFELADVERDTLLRATARTNVSCAMRFSHWPVSRSAQRYLVSAARRFLPAHPDEGMLPLRVSRLSDKELRWISDREQHFLNYAKNPVTARRRMGPLFAVASAALSAQNFGMDDKTTHEVTAFVPSLTALPISLQFTFDSFTAEAGWSRSRCVSTWVVGSSTLVRTIVGSARFQPSQKTMEIELHSGQNQHRTLANAIRRYGIVNEENNTAQVPIYIRLCRESVGADPIFDISASVSLLKPLLHPSGSSLANTILDTVYASRRRVSFAPPTRLTRSLPTSIQVGCRNLHLKNEQALAIQLGTEDYPILAIQAAFGTGKTLVGAAIAARLASAGQQVIVTATTNVAVAQFTDTLLQLGGYNHLHILRFLCDSALMEGAPTTDVDLHHILKSLLTNYSDSISDKETDHLTTYSRGRELIEGLILKPDTTTNLTDEEREEFRIAENQNSEATRKAVKIMLRVRFPSIMCITTASLLNTTKPGGLFSDVLSTSKVIIGDEASQIPEPVFVAMLGRFPSAKHIYIGNVNQLEPHVRCPRSSRAARLGAKGIMELLMAKEIPLVHLVTTYRAHPALNALPNRLVYDGDLVSGTPARRRQMITSHLRLPNPELPLVVIDVPGRSRLSPSQSHSNEQEAQCCKELICGLLAKDIPATSIGVITFYKDQQRLMEDTAAKLGVHLFTVDSVQGREIDVVVILTTRTMVDRSSGEFLDDHKRLNVAITRCRHGLFILANVGALHGLHNWGTLIHWAREHRTIIAASQLPDIFA